MKSGKKFRSLHIPPLYLFIFWKFQINNQEIVSLLDQFYLLLYFPTFHLKANQ